MHALEAVLGIFTLVLVIIKLSTYTTVGSTDELIAKTLKDNPKPMINKMRRAIHSEPYRCTDPDCNC